MLFSCASGVKERMPVSGTYYGIASYYGEKFNGRPTASGENFDMYGRTAAHKTLPFGTRLLITNVRSGRKVVVTVNDRGPFVKGRDLDLTYGAAREIGMIDEGTARVRIDILGRDMRYVKYIQFSADRGPFTIQTASFRDKENAFRLKNILAQSYKHVYIVPVSVSGDRYYRVCIGKFDSKPDVEAMAKRLADEGYGIIIITYKKQ